MVKEEADSKTSGGRLTIAVYAPYLQGLYLGELVNQVRQLCHLKGHRLVLIRTGGFGHFRSYLHINNIDAAVIIRNAVAPELAEKLVEAQIPCVSIAYDYFPLKIPVVASDNELGVRLAFQRLLEDGKKRIAFVGDLSHYDLRKRYEAYCQLHDEYQLPVREAYLYAVSDTLFAGGQEAAKLFLQQECDAEAVIFGAGLTGIGFVQYLKDTAAERAGALEFICFDSNPLIPVYAPEMLTVDQNFNLIAYRSLSVLESQLNQEPFNRHTMVQPKLVELAPEEPGPDATLATCADLPELENAHYMKALLANLHDWPREIGASQLEQLMSVAPMFSRFLSTAVLSRYFVDDKKSAWVKHTKTFRTDGARAVDVNDAASLARAGDFPSATVRGQFGEDWNICTHLPIHLNDKLWGFLSLMGDGAQTNMPSSYFGFAGFMESAVKLYEQELTLVQLKKALSLHAKPDQGGSVLAESDPNATVYWRLDTGITSWSDKALTLLGFCSEIERNVYQNLEITDRVHPDDLEVMRQAINDCRMQQTNTTVQVRFKMKNGEFATAVISAKSKMEDGKVKGINFCVGIRSGE